MGLCYIKLRFAGRRAADIANERRAQRPASTSPPAGVHSFLGDMSTFNHSILEAALVGLEAQKKRIEDRIAEVRAMLLGRPGQAAATPEATLGKRRKFSALTRSRMKAAQQRRWAKIRGESEPPAQARPEAPKAKRKLSAAGKKAIQEAVKRRWAQKRAEAAKAAPARKKAVVKKAAPARAAKKSAPVKKAAAKTAPAPAVEQTAG